MTATKSKQNEYNDSYFVLQNTHTHSYTHFFYTNKKIFINFDCFFIYLEKKTEEKMSCNKTACWKTHTLIHTHAYTIASTLRSPTNQYLWKIKLVIVGEKNKGKKIFAL